MQSNNPLPGVALPLVLCFILLLLPVASLASVQTYTFEPIVISTNVIEPVVLRVQTDGTYTSLSLAFSNGTERP